MVIGSVFGRDLARSSLTLKRPSVPKQRWMISLESWIFLRPVLLVCPLQAHLVQSWRSVTMMAMQQLLGLDGLHLLKLLGLQLVTLLMQQLVLVGVDASVSTVVSSSRTFLGEVVHVRRVVVVDVVDIVPVCWFARRAGKLVGVLVLQCVRCLT